MSYLSDRQRRELAILPRIIWAVVIQERALISDHPKEIEKLRSAMAQVCMEPLEGLDERRARRVANQIERAAQTVVADLEDQPNAKVIAICWHVMAHLIETGHLVIHEGTPMAEAAAVLEPAFQHVYDEPAVARSIDKQARRLLERIQAEGLWTAAPSMRAMEDA